jgi:hypothetical protein
MKTRILALAVASVAMTVGSSAYAVVSYNTNVDVYNTSGPEFIAGDGIPINGFAQDSVPSLLPVIPVPNTISASLKARDRDTGQANSVSGNRYIVDAGYSSTNPGISNLAIDFQFDPGSDVVSNYYLQLFIDFEPGFNSSNLAGYGFNIFDADANPANSWDDSDGYFTTNGGGGAWNHQTVPYVISNTTRMDFAFWNTVFGKTYDPNVPGEYEIILEVVDPTGFNLLAQTRIYAQVVPEPATLSLLSIAGIASLAVRRRIRSQR